MKGAARGKYYNAYRAYGQDSADGTTLTLQPISIISTPLKQLLPDSGGPMRHDAPS